ncbi:DNA-processing protein DprA [Humibacter ginsenosidimutans]|uniref:DNA-protecting protein DprA n=1 Tax=Humibacter ginsenosidimutans TaxID=2599293 RepID=A0A5B8M179_9MICO|nr:DNA-processing protein DprA [Humibacter ginsenosidimutans]QDZ14083.1 DNA-protecting protein DprA [Humibacter ginsenosidimutans]
MTVFGLDDSAVRRHIADVSEAGDLDEAAVGERFSRAAWSVITEPGDGAAGALIDELGSAEALRAVLADADHAGPATSGCAPAAEDLARWKPRLRSAEVLRALSLAARVGARLLIPENERGAPGYWPRGASDLGVHAPIALWALGDPQRLNGARSSVALVGARAATGYGEHVAGELSAGLCDRGFAIVSGAAYGIDGMAHRAALASGGLTFAFLAGGVDRFYPSGHDELLRRVVERGVVLAELPCGAAPTKWRFLQRNRLIAACSSATVVVEAGSRSGSLNTAGHASTLGRPLGAVPGPVTSPASAGCHRLLREYDAVCVTTVAEAAELAGEPAEQVGAEQAGSRDSATVVRLLDALSTRSGRSVDELVARTGLAVPAVLAALGALDVDGRVQERGGAWFAQPRRG